MTYTANSGATGQTGVGLLRVTTSPALPSQITVDGNIADTWGLNWLQIAPGSHTVCFSALQGYTTPACQSVTVTSGATTTVTGTFVQRGFLQVQTSPAVAGTIYINGIPADDWGVYTDLPVGTYTVCFGAVTRRPHPGLPDPDGHRRGHHHHHRHLLTGSPAGPPAGRWTTCCPNRAGGPRAMRPGPGGPGLPACRRGCG